MFSRMSKTWDRKVHCIRKNVCWKIDDKKASRSESGPLFQPLPEASDDEEKVEDVDLEELWKHIFELWKQGNHENARRLRAFPWPNVPGLQDLKGIVLLRSDLLITDIHEDVKAILGRVNVATVAPLVVAHTLERYRGELSHNQTLERLDASITNREEIWDLTEVMYDLAIVLKGWSERPERTQDVMQEATALIVEGARAFSLQRGPLKGGPPRSASEISAIGQKLHTMYMHITTEFTVCVFTPIQQRRRSHLSKKYPTHAGTPRCDEASSPGYSDLPKRSEGQDVDVNLNISGAPRCNEAPSSSSSSGPTKSRSDLISSKRKDKVEDVDLEELWKHIFELRKLREEGNHQEASFLGHFPWPDFPGLQKLKEIVSFGTDLPIEEIYGAVQAILEEIGRENVATAAPLVVAHTLERFDASITNREELWHLTEVMYDLAIALKTLSESPEGTQDVMQEATSLIVEGARVFSLQGGRRRSASEVRAIRQKLNTMYRHINTEFTVRVFTPIQHQRRSHLSKEYRTQAESDPFSQPLPEASHDEAPFSGSLNVSMKSKGKNVDVSLCDEASSDLPKTSEDFDVNLHISGAPRCDEAPSSSSSSSGPTKSKFDLIRNICKDFNLDDLMKHMSELLKLREKGNHQEASILGHFPWPDFPGLQKLKEIVSFGTYLLIQDIHGFVKALLKHVGRVNVAKARRKDNGQVEEDLLLTGQVEEDLLVLEPQKVYINTEQVEEDRLVPEPQKAYTHNHEPVEEDLLSTGRQKVFKMEALEVATNNFHKDNKVGEGAFGAVYKGTTHDGRQIAVKKMSFTSDRRSAEVFKKQFENEKLLAEVQHRNLVDLLGSCEQESQGFLVYEYLPNKSLDKFLFDPENRKRLDWHKRYNIIQGIARALQYLHEDSRVRIVHRDIKASNILLDEKMNAKLADFGTAKRFPEDRTHVTATSAAGTFGYMPPEYVMTGRLSEKTDVYSFGIVLLEILTGEEISADALTSLGRVWSLYNRKEALQTIDPTIIETWDKEATEALRCIQVGLLCIQGNSWLRPTMAEVIAMLSTDKSLPDPKNPPFLPSYCATQENGNSAMEKLMFNGE